MRVNFTLKNEMLPIFEENSQIWCYMVTSNT
jgi:hypothetical protein